MQEIFDYLKAPFGTDLVLVAEKCVGYWSYILGIWGEAYAKRHESTIELDRYRHEFGGKEQQNSKKNVSEAYLGRAIIGDSTYIELLTRLNKAKELEHVCENLKEALRAKCSLLEALIQKGGNV